MADKSPILKPLDGTDATYCKLVRMQKRGCVVGCQEVSSKFVRTRTVLARMMISPQMDQFLM
jgi:hypothetical protein